MTALPGKFHILDGAADGADGEFGGAAREPGVLIAECRRAGWPGLVPSNRWSLAAVPRLLLAELARARRGVVVLAVDGLSHGAAASAWTSAELSYLTSTFPSTSAPAWLTASTGVGPAMHGVPGMVYRVGGSLVYAVTGQSVAGERVTPAGAVLPHPTVFERAAAAGVRCLALGRELDHLPGPWAPAVLRGTAPAGTAPAGSAPEMRGVPDGAAPPPTLAAQAADPQLLVDTVAAEVTAVLALPRSQRAERVFEGRETTFSPLNAQVLLWVYVNLDDYVHAHGYDGAVLAAMRRLEVAATGWASDGWTVVAHSDHGQVRVRPDPALAQAWAAVDEPGACELPGGGAGRVRWLYPRPGYEDAVRRRLADALGDTAVVLPATDLGLPLDRVGAVVAIAASDRFPVPDPALRYEHGGTDPDEMIIPFAVWRPSRR